MWKNYTHYIIIPQRKLNELPSFSWHVARRPAAKIRNSFFMFVYFSKIKNLRHTFLMYTNSRMIFTNNRINKLIINGYWTRSHTSKHKKSNDFSIKLTNYYLSLHPKYIAMGKISTVQTTELVRTSQSWDGVGLQHSNIKQRMAQSVTAWMQDM